MPLKNAKKTNFIFEFLKCARFNLAQNLCQSISLLYLTSCKNSGLQEDFDENMFFLQHCESVVKHIKWSSCREKGKRKKGVHVWNLCSKPENFIVRLMRHLRIKQTKVWNPTCACTLVYQEPV